MLRESGQSGPHSAASRSNSMSVPSLLVGAGRAQ